MLLQIEDHIEVPRYYMSRCENDELLGFLPVLVPDQHSYYTVENISPSREFDRVSPVFGSYSDVITDSEYWYQKPIHKNAREEDKLQHEYYRDEFLERLETHKYCVWFVGCDDGDNFIRFESKDKALEYLSSIEYFEEIYNNPHCQLW
ncbi:hypothetical protein ACUYQI_000703 [Salmonella enterica subsp. enterica serovar Braenderup]